jgi:hypothetical protein
MQSSILVRVRIHLALHSKLYRYFQLSRIVVLQATCSTIILYQREWTIYSQLQLTGKPYDRCLVMLQFWSEHDPATDRRKAL